MNHRLVSMPQLDYHYRIRRQTIIPRYAVVKLAFNCYLLYTIKHSSQLIVLDTEFGFPSLLSMRFLVLLSGTVP